MAHMTNEAGDQFWYLDDGRLTLHRSGGPAIIYANGEEHWYCHGKLHRVGGPAWTRYDGRQSWMMFGDCHRNDGPAIIFPDGTSYFFLHDHFYIDFDEWLQKTDASEEKKIFLKLRYG